MIPDQARAITSSFLHQVQNGRDVYQTDYLAKDAIIVQPGAMAFIRISSLPAPRLSRPFRPLVKNTRSRNSIS